nr:MAG TPA: Stationary phase protein 4 [Caudoviricetes sp.]
MNFEELYQRFRKNEPITRLAKECPEISESTLRLRL